MCCTCAAHAPTFLHKHGHQHKVQLLVVVGHQEAQLPVAPHELSMQVCKVVHGPVVVVVTTAGSGVSGGVEQPTGRGLSLRQHQERMLRKLSQLLPQPPDYQPATT